jgi:hypothetical protein
MDSQGFPGAERAARDGCLVTKRSQSRLGSDQVVDADNFRDVR